jgi:hypothetical protein
MRSEFIPIRRQGKDSQINSNPFVKKCALIEVNELKEKCRIEREMYWKQVKTEVENL